MAQRRSHGPGQGLLASALVMMLCLSACNQSGPEVPRPLAEGFPAINFDLVDGQGRAVTAQSLHGEVVVLTFGFTRCTRSCPTVMWQLRETLDLMPPDQRDRVQVVFVGVDYRNDSPIDVSRYAAAFGERFMGLTGDPEATRELNRHLGVSARYLATGDGPDLIHHATSMFLIDGRGKPRYLARPGVDPPALATVLAQMVTGT